MSRQVRRTERGEVSNEKPQTARPDDMAGRGDCRRVGGEIVERSVCKRGGEGAEKCLRPCGRSKVESAGRSWFPKRDWWGFEEGS